MSSAVSRFLIVLCYRSCLTDFPVAFLKLSKLIMLFS